MSNVWSTGLIMAPLTSLHCHTEMCCRAIQAICGGCLGSACRCRIIIGSGKPAIYHDFIYRLTFLMHHHVIGYMSPWRMFHSILFSYLFVFLSYWCYGGLPFPDTGCPVPDVYIYYVPDMINVSTLFLHLSTSLGCFRPRTFFFEQRIGQYRMGLLYIRFTY